jgi:ubiquinone/menaquinone biosynthesis C-methylase UbiE
MMTPTRSLVSTAAATALAALLASAPACGGSSADAPAAASPQPAHAAPGHDAAQHHQAAGHHAGSAQHSFERAEDWARLFDHPSRDAWQKPDEVVALADLSPGMSVVDVGAGTGYFMTRLSRAVGPRGSVVATDIEPDMVRYMKERAAREKLVNVQVVTAPVDDVGVPAASADRILIVDVWHHIADRERYAAKMARALKPGGAVLVVDFTMETRRGPSPSHRLPPDRVIAELTAGGLVAEVATESLPDQYVVIGRRR